MALRILKDVEFHNWALDAGLSDRELLTAAREVEAGLIDARLGGSLFKKRVAIQGRGKRGGFRTIIGTNMRSALFSFTALPRMKARTLRVKNRMC